MYQCLSFASDLRHIAEMDRLRIRGSAHKFSSLLAQVACARTQMSGDQTLKSNLFIWCRVHVIGSVIV
jgi:hypothetical protein